jgi:hypothetical protein
VSAALQCDSVDQNSRVGATGCCFLQGWQLARAGRSCGEGWTGESLSYLTLVCYVVVSAGPVICTRWQMVEDLDGLESLLPALCVLRW